MEENKEIVQDEIRSTDPQESRKNILIELNTEENHQIISSRIKEILEKIDVLESKHQDKLKEFELIEEEHFTIYEEYNKIKSDYESLIKKPQIKSINTKLLSTAKKREINIEKDSNKLESHSVSSSSGKFGKAKLDIKLPVETPKNKKYLRQDNQAHSTAPKSTKHSATVNLDFKKREISVSRSLKSAMKKEDNETNTTNTIKVKTNKEVKENHKEEKADLRKKRTSKEIKPKEENLKGKLDKNKEKKEEHKNPVVKKEIKKKGAGDKKDNHKEESKFVEKKEDTTNSHGQGEIKLDEKKEESSVKNDADITTEKHEIESKTESENKDANSDLKVTYQENDQHIQEGIN